MAPTLYLTIGSSPCHQVLLTAKALNLELELKPVDLMSREHIQPEYLKLNPQHTVPTLVDGDFALWESRAISRYLVNKYGAGSKLYPQDPQARAVVDQRLDFDFGTSQKFTEYFYSTIMEKKQPDEAKLKKVMEALTFLNTFLEGSKYAAGPDLTIADFALVASVTFVEVANLSLKAFPNIVRWYELMKEMPIYEEAIQKHVGTFKVLMEQAKAKNA